MWKLLVHFSRQENKLNNICVNTQTQLTQQKLVKFPTKLFPSLKCNREVNKSFRLIMFLGPFIYCKGKLLLRAKMDNLHPQSYNLLQNVYVEQDFVISILLIAQGYVQCHNFLPVR